MGWGRTNNLRGDSGDKKEGGAYKNVLQTLAIPAINIKKCRNNPKWRSFARITQDRQICAGGEILVSLGLTASGNRGVLAGAVRENSSMV